MVLPDLERNFRHARVLGLREAERAGFDHEPELPRVDFRQARQVNPHREWPQDSCATVFDKRVPNGPAGMPNNRGVQTTYAKRARHEPLFLCGHIDSTWQREQGHVPSPRLFTQDAATCDVHREVVWGVRTCGHPSDPVLAELVEPRAWQAPPPSC